MPDINKVHAEMNGNSEDDLSEIVSNHSLTPDNSSATHAGSSRRQDTAAAATSIDSLLDRGLNGQVNGSNSSQRNVINGTPNSIQRRRTAPAQRPASDANKWLDTPARRNRPDRQHHGGYELNISPVYLRIHTLLLEDDV